jgi:hypothetical protein
MGINATSVLFLLLIFVCWVANIFWYAPLVLVLLLFLVLGTLVPVGTGDARVVMDGFYVKFLALACCLDWFG